MAVPTRNGVSYNGANGTNVTVNYPGGSSSGDLVILHAYASWSTASARTLSPGGGGWNTIEVENDTSTNGIYHGIWWKFRGSETSVTVTASTTTNLRGVVAQLVSYSGSTVDAETPCLTSNYTYGAGVAGTSTVGQSITTVTNDAQILHFTGAAWVGGALTVSSWSGGTEISDNTTQLTLNGVSTVMSVAVEDKTTAGATTARTATYSQSSFQRFLATVAVYPPFTPPIVIEHVGAAQGTTTISPPSGTQDGDIMICAVVDDSGSGTFSWPAGWNDLGQQVSVACRISVAWRRYTTGDTTWSAPSGTVGHVISSYRNVDDTSPIMNSSFGTAGADATPTTASVSNTDANSWGVAIFGQEDFTGRTFNSVDSGFIERAEYDGTSVNIALTDSQGTMSVASHAITGTWNGAPDSNATWFGFLRYDPGIIPVSASDTGTGTDTATVNVVTPAPGPTVVQGVTATGTGTDLVFTYPSLSVSGDYLTAFVHFYKTSGTTAPTITTPSGWTLLETQNATGTEPYVAALYGRVRGAETSATFSANTGTDVQSIGELYAYRGTQSASPVADSEISYIAETDTSHPTPALTTSTENIVYRAVVANGAFATTPSMTWPSSSEVTDISGTAGTGQVNLSSALKPYASPTSTGTETVTQAATPTALAPRGMDKSGTQSVSGSVGTYKVTGWAPQFGTSSGEIVNDELIVNGTGRIIVTANFNWSGSLGGVSSLRIYKNGVEVQSNAHLTGLTGSTRTDANWAIGWIGDVVTGDSIAIYVNRSSAGTTRTINSGFLKYDMVPDTQFASDTFDGTGALSGDWTTTGGGTLVRTSGELDGTGTPSVPLSYAWHDNAPSNPAYVRVKVTQRKHGRNPEHSSWGPVLRASPGDDHGNPGEENGITFVVTDSITVIYYEDFSVAEGWVALTPGSPPYMYIGPNGYPEGAVLEIVAINEWYHAIVNGTVVMTGTTTAIDQTNTVVGAMIQNDELEAGGGQPPANLDDWAAYTGNNTGGSGTAHTFSVAVAIQIPQDIDLPADDAGSGSDNAVTTATTAGSDASALTADTATGQTIGGAVDSSGVTADNAAVDADSTISDDTGSGADNAVTTSTTTDSDVGSGADDATISVTQYGTDTGQAVEPDAVLTVADTESGFAADDSTQRITAEGDTGTTSFEDAGLYSQRSADPDTGSGADDALGITVVETDAGAGADTSTVDADTPISSDTGSGLDVETVGVVEADAGALADDAFSSNTEQVFDASNPTTDDAIIVFVETDSFASEDQAVTDADTAPEELGIGSEDASVLVADSDVRPDAVDSVTLRMDVFETPSAVDNAGLLVFQFGIDTGSGADDSLMSLPDTDTGSFEDTALRRTSGFLIAPRVYRVEEEQRFVRIPRESRTRTAESETRLVIIGKGAAYYDNGMPADTLLQSRTIRVLPEDRTTVIGFAYQEV